ncbi:MAG TPA: glycosyltransferase, partial [Tepidisphaeraceae bacterium]|nr:glycosyltransferase [Tepidisphaeraceae bacterium]
MGGIYDPRVLDQTDAQPESRRSAPARRLKCVHFLRSVRLEEGGVVRAVLDICGGLAARGHEVTLVSCDATDVPPEWKSGAPGVPRSIVAPTRGIGSDPQIESLLTQADVLHLHTPWERMNLSLAGLARRDGVPYVVSIHGMLDEWSMRQKTFKKGLYLALVGKWFLAKAAAVHCTARAELEQASRYLRPGSGVVVPLPIDLTAYAQLPGPEEALTAFHRIEADVPRVLFLSRLHPKKRPELVIEAAAR